MNNIDHNSFKICFRRLFFWLVTTILTKPPFAKIVDSVYTFTSFVNGAIVSEYTLKYNFELHSK